MIWFDSIVYFYDVIGWGLLLNKNICKFYYWFIFYLFIDMKRLYDLINECGVYINNVVDNIC